MILSRCRKFAGLCSFVTLIASSGYAAGADDESAIISVLNKWNASSSIRSEALHIDRERRPMTGGGGAFMISRGENTELPMVDMKISKPTVEVVGSKANVTFSRVLKIGRGQAVDTFPSNERFSLTLEKKNGVWRVNEDSLSSQVSITRD